jgi:Spy/CpxP family protein refolding chaperone
MSRRTIVTVALVAVVALAGTTAAVGAEKYGQAKRAGGLKALGFKVYWSLLDSEQKDQAKEIISDFLAETASDRLSALSRLIKYKADVADVLTKEQRRKAGKIRWAVRQLPEEKRKALIDEVLDGTDRQALADRVERHASASPEDKVAIGLEILDQVYEAVEPRLAEKLSLTREQRDRIKELFTELKTDLEPVAIRIEKAKAEAVRKGISILDEEQRGKLEKFKEDVSEKVLAFIRG